MQVVALTVALANGTIATVSNYSHPHLMRALCVSVGRLGIILDLTLKVVPNNMVRGRDQPTLITVKCVFTYTSYNTLSQRTIT